MLVEALLSAAQKIEITSEYRTRGSDVKISVTKNSNENWVTVYRIAYSCHRKNAPAEQPVVVLNEHIEGRTTHAPFYTETFVHQKTGRIFYYMLGARAKYGKNRVEALDILEKLIDSIVESGI